MSRKSTGAFCALIAAYFVGGPLLAADQDPSPGKRVRTYVGMKISVVLLEHAESREVARRVRSLFQTEEQMNKATWFRPINAVLLRGTPEEVEQMEFLIAQIDRALDKVTEAPKPKRVIELIPVHHARAQELVHVAGRVVVARDEQSRSRGGPSAGVSGPPIWYKVDSRTNTIVVLGTKRQIATLKELVAALDVPVEAQRVDKK